MTPEYHFTSSQLTDYLDKVRPAMVLAERERCAKIVDTAIRAIHESDKLGASPDCLETIANLIRNP